MATKKIYLYPLWLRIWHHVNAVLMLALILTGVSMQYSNPDYPLIRFDIAVSVHNISGIMLTLSYFYFFLGILFTSIGRHYVMKQGFFKAFYQQAKYYLFGIFRGEPHPFPVNAERKFNPIQQITYNVIQHAITPVTFVTGWALLYPETIILNVFGYSGIMLTSLLHVAAGFLISVFLVIHLYFITVGHSVTSNLKSMITGYHEINEEEGENKNNLESAGDQQEEIK
ncbi:Thiosulfate reductase cytochrome B subunit PhsC [bioreactor metagenome]|jgi:thiosulfate reductase cytochrome b subunit|uniref:Thiosulfate reductase cytochrome B subunit PhsC n=1 Tax=bioreactor metagenome TaxID=1076179 RepID=A0A644UT64_9ZZZZ|nr:cytochrome b/b6 domain-containing protein [Lentimicrobium sp.]MEA5109806.1 cytochrome b/b6 domain-containing protein [Lentimicrobium sp.]